MVLAALALGTVACGTGPGSNEEPTEAPTAFVQNIEQATTPCEKAVVALAQHEAQSSSLDDLADYLPVFRACSRSEFEAANLKFTTEWARAPAGFVDRRCREYSKKDELGQTKLCLSKK